MLLGIAAVGVLGYGLLSGDDEPETDPGGDESGTDPGGQAVEPVQAAVSTSVDGDVVTTTFVSNGNAEYLEVEIDCGDDGSVEATGTLESVGEDYSHACSGSSVARVTVVGVGEDREDVVHEETLELE